MSSDSRKSKFRGTESTDNIYLYELRRYVGSVIDGVPHGKGRMEFLSGYVYEGDFLEGQKHGKGMLKLASAEDKVLFDGEFRSDLPDGQCNRYLMSDDSIYRGDMAKGLRSGAGILVTPNKQVYYDGTWQNDVPHGRGTFLAPDGEYEGEWKMGRRHGKGKFTFKERPLASGKSRVYEGDWANDTPHGSGRYLADDGSSNVYKLDKGEIVAASIKAYKPMCGKGPEIQCKPATQQASFKPIVDTVWSKGKVSYSKGELGEVLGSATAETFERSWRAYEHDTTFIDPNKEIQLERVQHPEPPKLRD